MPSPSSTQVRASSRKGQSSNRTCYPSPVQSDAASDAYHHYIRDSSSPCSSDHDSINSIHSSWEPTSRGTSCSFERPVSPQLLSQAAVAGLGIKYTSSALFPTQELTMFDQHLPPAVVSPQMLEKPMSATAPSSIFMSNGSICSSMYDPSDVNSLDEYDMIHTPEPLSQEDAARIADERTWYTSPAAMFEPNALHIESELEYCHPQLQHIAPMHDYQLRCQVKCEEGPINAHIRCREPTEESSVGSDSDEDMEDDEGPCSRHPGNAPYDNPKYICKICSKGFMRTFNYNSHLATHNPHRERPFKCDWPHCNKDFFRSTDLKRHQNSVHVKSEDFRCGTCGSGFPRKDSLQRHRKDGCAHRVGPIIKRSSLSGVSRRSSKTASASADSAYTSPTSRKHTRKSSRNTVAVSEYLSRNEALAIARDDGSANMLDYASSECSKGVASSQPYYVHGRGHRDAYGTPESR